MSRVIFSPRVGICLCDGRSSSVIIFPFVVTAAKLINHQLTSDWRCFATATTIVVLTTNTIKTHVDISRICITVSWCIVVVLTTKTTTTDRNLKPITGAGGCGWQGFPSFLPYQHVQHLHYQESAGRGGSGGDRLCRDNQDRGGPKIPDYRPCRGAPSGVGASFSSCGRRHIV